MSETLIAAAYVLVLATFLGIILIQRVPPTLHTPLMSATNMISGVVLLGGMMVLGKVDSGFLQFLAFIAIACATANIVGGYVVTDRMLGMFKGRKDSAPAEKKGA